MEHWDLASLDVEPHKPQILHSTRGESRSITLHLPAGEELQDHEVRARSDARLLLVLAPWPGPGHPGARD
jgi:hypothetical protein